MVIPAFWWDFMLEIASYFVIWTRFVVVEIVAEFDIYTVVPRVFFHSPFHIKSLFTNTAFKRSLFLWCSKCSSSFQLSVKVLSQFSHLWVLGCISFMCFVRLSLSFNVLLQTLQLIKFGSFPFSMLLSCLAWSNSLLRSPICLS